MSESSSYFTDTSDSRDAVRSGVRSDDIVGTNVPLVLISAYTEQQMNGADKVKSLPQLPSHRYRHTTWHELRQTHIKGDQLKAPRVREGPSRKEKAFYTLTSENGELIHHSKTGKERKHFRNETENWEKAEFANLSFQDLCDDYQRANFTRILKRLVSVIDLNIIDNGLVDIHPVTLPCCTHLNISNNHLNSLKGLPKVPNVLHLTACDNNIQSLDGITSLRRSVIESLHLKGNPVEFQEHYRKRIFDALPQLKVLDNIPKLASDEWQATDTKPKSGTCSVS